MDLEIIILIVLNQTKKNRYHMVSLYVESKKCDINELIYKTNRFTDLENKFMVMKGEKARRNKLGVWD